MATNAPVQPVDQDGDVVFVGYIDAEREIHFDPFNANEGTEFGDGLLEESLEQYGAGRSVLIDKDNYDIAGNKTLQKWIAKGGKVAVIETDGNTLIAVRRRDLDLLNDPRARDLAFADNRVGEKNLAWLPQRIVEAADAGSLGVKRMWSESEIEEFRQQLDLENMEALRAKHGTHDEHEYWATILLKVPPETMRAYQEVLEEIGEEEEHEGFALLLEHARSGMALAG